MFEMSLNLYEQKKTGYLMANPVHTYIFHIREILWFKGISTIVDYLIPNPFYKCLLNIKDLA